MGQIGFVDHIDRLHAHNIHDLLCRYLPDLIGQLPGQLRVPVLHNDRNDTGIGFDLDRYHPHQSLRRKLQLQPLDHLFSHRAALDQLRIVLRQVGAELQIRGCEIIAVFLGQDEDLRDRLILRHDKQLRTQEKQHHSHDPAQEDHPPFFRQDRQQISYIDLQAPGAFRILIHNLPMHSLL